MRTGEYEEFDNGSDEVNFVLRLPAKINEKIKEIAKEEGRSKNKEIEYILRMYIKEYEKGNQE